MNWAQTSTVALSIVAAGLIIAASIVFVGRWQISATSYGYGYLDSAVPSGESHTEIEAVYRLDRWTGKVEPMPVWP